MAVMKIVDIADLHLSWEQPISRLDNAMAVQLDKFAYILRWANDHDAWVAINGDMFDKPRSWYLLPKVIEILRAYSNVPVFTVFGQHDTYLYSATTRDATSLGILAKAGLVTILNKYPGHCLDCGEGGFWHLFGANYGEPVPEPLDGDSNILVIHAPIAEKALFPNQEYFDASQFLERHKFDLILCGDIHRRFKIVDKSGNRAIVNPGPMFRRTADEYNMSLEPGFFVIDFGLDELINVEFVGIPHEPSCDVLTREHLDKAQHNTKMLEGFVGLLTAPVAVDNGQPDGRINLVLNIWKFVEENNMEQEVVDLLSEVMGRQDER